MILEILVIKFPKNKEAPFEFKTENEIFLYERKQVNSKWDLLNIIRKNFSSVIIWSSGWIDNLYLKVIKDSKLKCKKVLMFDTLWENKLKQKIWITYFQI